MLFKISEDEINTGLNEFIYNFKNIILKHLPEIEKNNEKDAEKIKKYFSKVRGNPIQGSLEVMLDDNEIKELLTLINKHKTSIPLQERKKTLELYKEFERQMKVKHEVIELLKNNYNFDLESFAKETFSEKVQRFLEKETPGYFISLFAGPPIGFIGYGMQKYMGVPSILTHGTMGLLSLGTSYLTELTHEDIDEYPGIFSWEHLKSRWGHIGTKTLISYLGAHVTKKILEDINKPQEML